MIDILVGVTNFQIVVWHNLFIEMKSKLNEVSECTEPNLMQTKIWINKLILNYLPPEIRDNDQNQSAPIKHTWFIANYAINLAFFVAFTVGNKYYL